MEPDRTMYVDVNGTRLYCETFGEGTPLVCLHGGLGINRAYLKAPGILGLTTSNHEVVFYDQRGHGYSGRCDPETYTHLNWVNDLHELSRVLGYERFSLLGHSYGGFLAIQYALTWPDSLDRLILVGTSAGPVSIGAIPEVRSDADLKMIFKAQWSSYFWGSNKHWDVFEGIDFSLDPFLAAFQVELPGYDLRDRVGEIRLPTLLVSGSADRYLAAMRWLDDNLVDSPLVVLENCVHMPFYEHPGAFLSALLDFLR